MTTPELLSPPVYACAAGAVLHAHASSTLEPAVLLHTFLPPGAGEQLGGAGAQVDVHGNGPGAETLTVRVLAEGRSVAWELPIAPFVAALPGQLGDDGRMVLLAVVDAEPEAGFWARPADCEQLAAELQLPVSDLVDALSGRLTRWLADDLEGLLHDDAHDRAVDRSPAQTLALAVLAHYRGDLQAEAATTRVVRALELAPEGFSLELGGRLCAALVTAVQATGPAAVEAVRASTGPFEAEAVRLLGELPPVLATRPATEHVDATMQLLLAGQDRDEVVRAAVALVGRLARQGFGEGLPDEEVLRRLAMVDDAGLVRLARLWVALGAALSAPPAGDGAVAAEVARAVVAEGPPAAAWLRETAAALVDLAREAASARGARGLGERLAPSAGALVQALEEPLDLGTADRALSAALTLARLLRERTGTGPGSWCELPPPSAMTAVMSALLEGGLDGEVAVDLLDELLEDDVEGPDLLDGFVCATSQLLVEADAQLDPALRRAQVAELLADVPGGPRGARWLMAALLREAPGHDPAAVDLGRHLPSDPAVDPDRAADRAGRPGVLRAGLACLEALSRALSEEAAMPREELLGQVLPSAFVEHSLLARDDDEDDR